MSPPSADSTAFIDNVAITPVVDTILDGGFEQPALAANAFATDPSGSAWQFSGTAGMARNGSDFATNWTEAQNAPAGAQVAYIQDTGSMSQTVYLDAGTYQLSFLAAQRAIYQTHYQEIEVLVDGAPAGVVNPVNTLFGSYQSSTFTVATGPHTIDLPRFGSPGRRQHRLHRPGDALGQRHPRRQFRDAGIGRGTPTNSRPLGTPWQFSATAGVARNGSSYHRRQSQRPRRHQVAFIQGNGSMSQSVNLVAGSYNISFEAAQRANGQLEPANQGAWSTARQVGLITPFGTSYSLYETSNFTVAAGPHTIQFIGMSPQGSTTTALIDEVALNAGGRRNHRRRFRDAGLGREHLPGRAQRHALAVLRIGRHEHQCDSSLTAGNATAPQGDQVGFLMNTGSMSQTVYLDADTYDLSFLAVQRVDRPDRKPANPGAGRRHAGRRLDHAHQHHRHFDTEFHPHVHCLTRRRISRSRPACIRSRSSA